MLGFNSFRAALKPIVTLPGAILPYYHSETVWHVVRLRTASKVLELTWLIFQIDVERKGSFSLEREIIPVWRSLVKLLQLQLF